MSELVGWTLAVVGVVAIVSVIGALFLPDWPSPPYTMGVEPDPGSERFMHQTGSTGITPPSGSPRVEGGSFVERGPR